MAKRNTGTGRPDGPRAPRFERFIESKPVFLILSIFNWPRRMIRRLYAWVIGWAESRRAQQALGGIAFAESSFFPIPPDPLLIAMTTAKPRRYLRFATICTAASVVGGIFGYLIGVLAFEAVGQPIIDTYHLQEDFDALGRRYSDSAAVAIFAAAFSPIPYKLITISAGAFHINFLLFLLVSILGRGGRFFLVATLMHHFGKRYKDTIEKYIDLLSLLFVLLLVFGVLAVKLL